MAVRFDPAGPYEVDETDTPFARPGGADLLARLYRPRVAADRPLGAVVYVHGGAWARSDRTGDAILCGALAASGVVVVALDFRQAPDHRFPIASADVAAGVRYARAHAERLHVDPARIGLLGSSSGGQLALLHAVKPDAPEAAGTPIVRPDGSLDPAAGDARVAFVMALYPVADPLARYHYALSREHEPPPPSGFDAKRLIASHRAFFADEAAMEAASVTRLVGSRPGHRAAAGLGRPAGPGRQCPRRHHRGVREGVRGRGRPDRARALPGRAPRLRPAGEPGYRPVRRPRARLHRPAARPELMEHPFPIVRHPAAGNSARRSW